MQKTNRKTRPVASATTGRKTAMIQHRGNTNGQRSKRLFAFQPMSARAGGAENKNSWRDHWQIHPAADVFPLMSADELRKLADDIAKNGIKVGIQTRSVAGENAPYLIDGRNRLDAMEKVLGWQIVNAKGEWLGALTNVQGGKPKVEHQAGRTHEQIMAEIRAYNIERRHLTKQEIVEMIDATLKATREFHIIDDVKLKQGVGRPADLHKAELIKQSAKVGISKPTVERARRSIAAKRAADLIKRDGKAPPKRKPKPEVDKTSDKFIVGRFNNFMGYWPVTQQRVVRRKLREILLGRVEHKDGKERVVVPEFVIWPDGKKQKLEDVILKAQK